MAVLDRAVIETVKPLLAPSWRPEAALHIRVRDAVERIELSAQALAITLATTALSSAAASDGQPSFRIVRDIAFARPRNSTVLIRSGVEAPNADRALIRAIVIAHAWMQRLNGGESIAALAKADGLCPIHTARLLPLAYLAPDLTTIILEGRQPRTMTLTALAAEPLPLAWDEQRARFQSFL